MTTLLKARIKLLGTVAFFISSCIMCSSFQNSPFGPIDKLENLTEMAEMPPEKKPEASVQQMTINEFDELMQNIDAEIVKLNSKLSTIDFPFVQREIAASLNKINLDELSAAMNSSITQKEIDQVEKEMQSAVNSTDWTKTDPQLKRTLEEAIATFKKLNLHQLQAELRVAHQQIQHSKRTLQKMNVDQLLQDSNQGINNAKSELRATKQMFIEMEKDGLISQQKGFTLEFTPTALLINGIQQPDMVRTKYKKYSPKAIYKITIRGQQ